MTLFDVPSLVLVEDVHRADPASLRFLVHPAHEVSRRPALLVTTFRPNPADHSPSFGTALDQIVDLVGPAGLLTGLTKSVLESALDAEVTEHLAYDKHDPAGRGSGFRSRTETVDHRRSGA